MIFLIYEISLTYYTGNVHFPSFNSSSYLIFESHMTPYLTPRERLSSLHEMFMIYLTFSWLCIFFCCACREGYGDGLNWAGCTIMTLLNQARKYELLDFASHIQRVNEVDGKLADINGIVSQYLTWVVLTLCPSQWRSLLPYRFLWRSILAKARNEALIVGSYVVYEALGKEGGG